MSTEIKNLRATRDAIKAERAEIGQMTKYINRETLADFTARDNARIQRDDDLLEQWIALGREMAPLLDAAHAAGVDCEDHTCRFCLPIRHAAKASS